MIKFRLNTIFVLTCTLLPLYPFTYAHTVNNLFTLQKQAILYPSTVNELQLMVQKAAQQQTKIALVGADKSQGGQTVSTDASIRINLKHMNKLITLDIRNKQVTVEAGMTWAELEQHIAPHRLSIKAMQSYNDFSIGGSLSVNVHGQDFRYAPLIETVVACKMILADGTTTTISRTENPELFSLAIGGYGLFGIIYEVTLSLTDDVILQRKATVIPSSGLAEYFTTQLKNNPLVAFYSGRFSMGSSHLLDRVLIITYETTKEHNPDLLTLGSAKKDFWTKYLIKLTGDWPLIKNTRLYIESICNQMPHKISRNNMLNYSIETLPQDSDTASYILQEYFIPYAHIDNFIKTLKLTVQEYNINLINITARHVPQNTESVLSYSREDVCAFVLFVKIDKTTTSYHKVHHWTQQLINQAITCNGAFYLPYHLLATKEQVRAAYPRFQEFVDLKRTYDPQELFSNMLYETYA